MRMAPKHITIVALFGLLLLLAGSALYAQTPEEAILDAVATSGVFPAGTVATVAIDGTACVVDLSIEAVMPGLTDTQSDAYTDAIYDALTAWPEISSVDITVGGTPITAFLPASTLPDFEASGGTGLQSVGQSGFGLKAAQRPNVPPVVDPLSGELAGKLIVLGPSHGSYAGTSSWYRAMRTFCGPNPSTNCPPDRKPQYMPSDYYYYVKGYTWPMYYEDDMSPQLIRFLYAYCKAAGATTYCHRNLDETAGIYPAVQYGYPAPGFTMPKWLVACKYHLQDLGYVPSTVWNTSDVSTQSDKDLRARAYYVNWLMQTQGFDYTNTIYLALHSNAATATQCTPNQAQARGTETYNSLANTTWKTEQAQSPTLSSITCAAIVNSIREEYDGFWANSQYNLPNPPPEWCTGYGTYRGYDHAAPSTPSSTAGWQNRGPKSGNYGEIRECKCPATLVELLFHDDWKFYPDQAFHQDPIFRATVTWGMYEGFCSFFGVQPRARLNASVESVSFPTLVGPNAPVAGTVAMKNLGQAWCWGKKMIGTVWSDYNVWDLKGTADDQFGQAGVKIPIANDGVYYPGDVAEFQVSLTSPATTGLYTTSWKMVKDDQRGGDFGEVATAQIQVDADPPEITIDSPTASDYQYGQVQVDFSAADALSDVASLTADIDGVAVTDGQVVSWLPLGQHTLTVNAADTFGNATSKSVTFNVVNSVGKVTIGGWIELENKKGTCGFNCEYVAGAPAPTGNMTYQDHDTGMTVHSLNMIAMGIVGNHAWFYGTCTIEGQAGHWFRVDVVDNGEPGSNDVFNIQLDTGYSQGGTLGGGNVTIH